MILRWIAIITVAGVIVSGLGVYKFFEIKATIDAVEEQPEYFETVEAELAKPTTHVPKVTALGVVVAPQQVTLRNELPGYITAVNFQSGAAVKKGEVILQLDISEQLANLSSEEVRAKLAESVYRRGVELRKSDAVSEETTERSLAEWNVIKADIAATRSIISRRTIRAPFDGVIGIHQFEVGQYLNINTKITTLVGSTKERWVDFSLPQFYGELAMGIIVRAQLIRSYDQINSAYFNATIIAGDSVITAGSRSRLYRALVTEGAQQLTHNASVKVEVPVGQARLLSALPVQSIRSDRGGQFVFALDPDHEKAGYYRARRIPVSVESEQQERTLVVGDLNHGDLVATAGSFKLYPGMLAQISDRPVITTTKQE
ncbi:efflux RND transporter periplasmic adaptor subunit [Microbulbifer spongiae]|uniref:Efflux RND transporter periplasmic adaptor subunit n=1 Tax=Microbulbifer spongiae TaxID=2944933 RepID=A0ABY9EA41_9GAMM|nr:efflux RND transporter periplasmic adaptor subunit [Microbulbifer sp. MI-G]WKD48374.1 efflux RND transporter periplasmic adaptor subunit [Microbulbifer sp. MI-G]